MDMWALYQTNTIDLPVYPFPTVIFVAKESLLKALGVGGGIRKMWVPDVCYTGREF